MPKLVMQIAKLDAPSIDAAGRKFGAKAYDSAGTKYTVPKAMFGMLQVGGWYEIFYEEKTFQGNPYKEIITANATQPLSAPAQAAHMSAHVQPHDKDIQIWCNSMLQRAIDHDKVDPWNEEACCELVEIQRRVFRRTFLGEEPTPVVPQPRANGPAPSTGAQGVKPPDSGQRYDREMDEEIPFD